MTMRTFIRTLYNILIPFAVALLIFTLFNFEVRGAYSSAIINSDGTHMDTNFSIRWMSPLFSGTEMTISQRFAPEGVNEAGETIWKPLSTVIYWPTIYLHIFAMIGVGLLIAATWLIAVGYVHKSTTVIGLVLLVLGSSFLLGQWSATWAGFNLTLIGRNGSSDFTFMSFPLPWLSTGLAMVIVDALAILESIFILSKQKKFTRPETIYERNAI